MSECDQLVQQFENNYKKDSFIRLQVVRNKDSSKTSIYIEQSSGNMISCKQSSKIFDMKLMTNQELRNFMDSCLRELPIRTYTLNNVG